VNSLVRPGIVRLFTYQLISRGASGVLYYHWRQPRIGNEKFYGAVLPHHLHQNNRVYREISQIGEELKLLAPVIKGTKVVAEACILYSHDNDWALQQPMQPNKFFNLRDHIQLIYTALHDRNISIDFARPTEDLSKYSLVFAPSLHLMAGGEADRLKLYVQNGGTLVGTFNTGLVDEHQMAPTPAIPTTSPIYSVWRSPNSTHCRPARKTILLSKAHFRPVTCTRRVCGATSSSRTVARFSRRMRRTFYSGTPAMTMNTFGLGKAIYIGTMSHQHFYYDLVTWLRQMCNLHPLLKVPDTVEVSLRQKEGTKVFFLLNHQNSPVRIQFYKPMHDFLTGSTFSGNYDLPPHGVLVLDEHPEAKAVGETSIQV
jgi:beta-galactosidase